MKFAYLSIVLLLFFNIMTCSIQAQDDRVSSDVVNVTAEEQKKENLFREIFRDLIPKLESALELEKVHEDLPERTFFYGKDQRDNQKEINEILDDAIEILNVSPGNVERQRIREWRDMIQEAQVNIAKYKEQRVTAPRENELGALGKMNPLKRTKKDYDQLIENEKENIVDYKQRIQDIKRDFTNRLESMGLDVSREEVDCLLSSVVGDDFVELSNVFNNLKRVTVQLQKLTEESGESLAIAKRYYGMYVILNQILDRLQDQFVNKINDKYLPKLGNAIQNANDNIDEAKALLAKQENESNILQSNIESNRLTIEAARLYVNYLQSQEEMMREENEKVEKNLATARNTYKTVKVSSQVAELIQSGRKDFEALMDLELPVLRGFENQVIQREFQRLTQEIEEG